MTVFDVIHDYDLRLSWDAMLSRAELLGPEPAVGVKSLCVGTWKTGFLPFETEYIAFVPGQVAAVKLTNRPAFFERFAASIRHRDRGTLGSRVTYSYSFRARPRWLAFFLEPILDWRLKREVQNRLAALKSFVERRVKRDRRVRSVDTV